MIDEQFERRLRPCLFALACALGSVSAARADDPPAPAPAPKPAPPPGNDQTYRPTVMVRKGTSQGSGTVIASVPGETLVLTASHVLEADGSPYIEVHRYNLGLEKRRTAEGWPRQIPARVVARDRDADLAVLRVEGFEAMPYVARIAPGTGEADRGEAVVSVGIDLGEKLASWRSRVIDYARIDLGKGGGDRPFLLIEKPPEHGRSGGGLFATDGSVVGVCIGRAEVVQGKRLGVFASGASIRRLLRENHLNAAVARSTDRRLPRPSPIDRTSGTAPAPPSPTPPRRRPGGRHPRAERSGEEGGHGPGEVEAGRADGRRASRRHRRPTMAGDRPRAARGRAETAGLGADAGPLGRRPGPEGRRPGEAEPSDGAADRSRSDGRPGEAVPWVSDRDPPGPLVAPPPGQRIGRPTHRRRRVVGQFGGGPRGVGASGGIGERGGLNSR